MKHELTENAIAAALFLNLRPRVKAIAPRYTPANWWECDVYSVTKSGYGVEYEIKLTLSDFRADAKKHKRELNPMHVASKTSARGYKKDRLEEGHVKGPSRFYYVVPIEIADEVENELPPFAGLKVATKAKTTPRAYVNDRADAKRLHNQKVSDDEIRKVHERLYHRFWNQFVKDAFSTRA